MAAITDAFADTNGTDLASHVSPGGQTWSNLNGPGNNLLIGSNSINTLSGADVSAVYGWNLPAISADLTFSIDYVMPLTSPNEFFFSITLRGSGSSGTGFKGDLALIGRTAGVLHLQINEDASALATLDIPALDDGLVHTLTLTVRGGLLQAYIDGVLKLKAYSATYELTQGQTRINVRNTHAGSVPSGFYLDNASVDSAPPQPLTLAPLVSVASPNRRMVPIPPTVMVFLTARHRPVPGALSLGGTGGSAPPIEGQLWPRGQKSG
jgi:hypothetical protein